MATAKKKTTKTKMPAAARINGGTFAPEVDPHG